MIFWVIALMASINVNLKSMVCQERKTPNGDSKTKRNKDRWGWRRLKRIRNDNLKSIAIFFFFFSKYEIDNLAPLKIFSSKMHTMRIICFISQAPWKTNTNCKSRPVGTNLNVSVGFLEHFPGKVCQFQWFHEL